MAADRNAGQPLGLASTGMVDISDIKPFKRCPKQWMPLGKEAPKAKSRPRKVSESKFLKARATRLDLLQSALGKLLNTLRPPIAGYGPRSHSGVAANPASRQEGSPRNLARPKRVCLGRSPNAIADRYLLNPTETKESAAHQPTGPANRPRYATAHEQRRWPSSTG